MRKQHLAVLAGAIREGHQEWNLQWAMPTTYWYVYGQPVETFTKRRDAVARKREIDRGMAKVHPLALSQLCAVLPGEWRFVSDGVELEKVALKFCASVEDGKAVLRVLDKASGVSKSFKWPTFDGCYRAFCRWANAGYPA